MNNVIERYKKALEKNIIDGIVLQAIQSSKNDFKGLEINRNSGEIVLHYTDRNDGTEKTISKAIADVEVAVPAVRSLFKKNMQTDKNNITYIMPKLGDIC